MNMTTVRWLAGVHIVVVTLAAICCGFALPEAGVLTAFALTMPFVTVGIALHAIEHPKLKQGQLWVVGVIWVAAALGVSVLRWQIAGAWYPQTVTYAAWLRSATDLTAMSCGTIGTAVVRAYVTCSEGDDD